jgi:putative protein kinase ArgK-like GTPase of G3E family
LFLTGNGAQLTVNALTAALDAAPARNWRVPVLKAVATGGQGVPEILSALAEHHTFLTQTPKGEWRRQHRVEHDVLGRLRVLLLERALRQLPPDALKAALLSVSDRAMPPGDAAEELMRATGG